jgi:hypothetical protein
MAASHPEIFKASIVDEEEILKLLEDCLLPPRAILQWWRTKGEDYPTLNTNEITMSKSIFQQGFGLRCYNFFWGLLDQFKIELFYLNPNSILHITIFVHLCEVCLEIFHHFAFFKHYFS